VFYSPLHICTQIREDPEPREPGVPELSLIVRPVTCRGDGRPFTKRQWHLCRGMRAAQASLTWSTVAQGTGIFKGIDFQTSHDCHV
jgi:hypothetical protein